MKVCIQQDMWDVAGRLPRGQRDLLVGALVAYGFSGEEPEESVESWYLLFLAFRGRIEMSAQRSGKAEAMARARWEGQDGGEDEQVGADRPDDSQVEKHAQNRDAQASGKHEQICDARASGRHGPEDHAENEYENEYEIEKNPPTPQGGSAGTSETDVAVREVVAHLNATCGTRFRASGRSTRRHVAARLREGRTVEEMAGVVDAMAALWLRNPHMRQFLRPETLFGPKFEGYLEVWRSRHGPGVPPRESYALPSGGPRPVEGGRDDQPA